MGTFENTNGVLTRLSTNITFNNTPSEQFVTEEELNNRFNQLDYVTLEMYGAGDGHTSDADAFRAALAENDRIYLGARTYSLGDEVIDLKNKKSMQLIGHNRTNSAIVGGTFLLNLNSDWTANNENKDGNKRDTLHLENIRFTNHRDEPQFVTASLISIHNCLLLGFKSFIALPNRCYIDKVCWSECDTWCDKTKDIDSTIIKGCDAPNVYSPWEGSGDDWCFKNCSFSTQGNSLFHISHGNHGVTFENCINPNICYSQMNSSEDLPQVSFTHCHFENKGDVCVLKTDNVHTYTNSKILLTFNNCYFHSSVIFNDSAEFMGLNYYTSRRYNFYDSSDFPTRGLTPSDLNKFIGIMLPNGNDKKHRKLITTQYTIPSIRSISRHEASWIESNATTTPLENHAMDYAFYYADNPYTYDSSTKIDFSNITPTINDYNRFRWDFKNIKNSGYQNFFIHVFRKDLTTNQVQKCVMYVGYGWLDLTSDWVSNNMIIEDGGDTIGGIYRWLDYDGEFPS